MRHGSGWFNDFSKLLRLTSPKHGSIITRIMRETNPNAEREPGVNPNPYKNSLIEHPPESNIVLGLMSEAAVERENEESPYLTGQDPDLGVRIAPENRCAPYDSGAYSYPQSVEQDIIEILGGIYSPYTGLCFESQADTDIEQIAASSEDHTSG